MPFGFLKDGKTAIRTGRPRLELALSDEESSQLQSFTRSRSLEAEQGHRGQVRMSFIERRIPELYERVAKPINTPLRTKPADG